MVFADKVAEEHYLNMVKKYGYFHINSEAPLTVECLNDVLDFILEDGEDSGDKKD